MILKDACVPNFIADKRSERFWCFTVSNFIGCIIDIDTVSPQLINVGLLQSCGKGLMQYRQV